MQKPKISLIAAIGENRELGKNGKLLWHIAEDLRRFKKFTTGHVVVMGRKTFEAIGKPLADRTNIIITRNKNFRAANCLIAYSVQAALAQAFELEKEEVFVIGGAEIYRQTIAEADRVYLTIVHENFPKADTYFPDYSRYFTKTISHRTSANENYSCTFLTLERSSS